MLVEELDSALIDTLGNCLADLMGRPTLDHVKARPSVLSLGTRRCSHEQRVSQLALQVVFLDVIREKGRNLPVGAVSAKLAANGSCMKGIRSSRLRLPCCQGRGMEGVLGISHTGEARPTDVGAIGKVAQQILWAAQLRQHRRPADARLQGGRSDWRGHGAIGL